MHYRIRYIIHACQISAKSGQACQISQLCGRCMLHNHIDAIDRLLPDYVINVVGKNIKYVIVVILSPQSYNLVGPMVL